MMACLPLGLTRFLLWSWYKSGASVRWEGSLQVIQGSKQDQHWSHSRLSRALFSWVQMPPKMESCFWVPLVIFFYPLSEKCFPCVWIEPFLFHHLSSCVKSLVLLALSSCWTSPLRLSLCLRKGQSLLSSSSWLCSVGTAQHAAGFPCCLTFNLPKVRGYVKLGLTFLSFRHPAAHLLYHGRFIHRSQGCYWSLWHTEARFQKAKGTEITHVNFSAGGVRCN